MKESVKSNKFTFTTNTIKDYLLTHYFPTIDIVDAEFHLTTNEVYEKLLTVFPFPNLFSLDTIAEWLHERGFTFADFGDMRFEWLFKRTS